MNALAAPYEIDVRRLRTPAVIFLAGGLLLAHLPAGVGLPCPLRTLTGVPCPLCGVTTSVRDTLGGRVRAGFTAAPLGLVLIVVAAAIAARWGPTNVRFLRPIVLVGVAAEWCFELHRFHFI
ncbi:MAG TPA: DUF2752 domain-containing protein [Acidimicrobiales bacterium]